MNDNDLISRSHFDERVRRVVSVDEELSADYIDGVDMVLYLLSAEPAVPTTGGDCVSRKAVIDLAMQYCPDDDGSCSRADVDMREMLDELEALPAAPHEMSAREFVRALFRLTSDFNEERWVVYRPWALRHPTKAIDELEDTKEPKEVNNE
jgi:hypothetical protein